MNDLRGNPVSTVSRAALEASNSALWRLVSFEDTPLADLARAQAHDPGWVLPPLMRAGFLLSLTEATLAPEVQLALDQAQALSTHALPRERAHLAALQRCAAGDWDGACQDWQALLDHYPRDLMALQWAHLFDFYRGDIPALQRRPAEVLPAWDADDPLRPYVLGQLAFGLEENGHHSAAEACGREAVAGPAPVPWATHAVAHVMEMTGRHQDGLAWLVQQHNTWAQGNGFGQHHAWHQALFHLETLDLPAAAGLYGQWLNRERAQITLNRLDGAALLWRLRLLGEHGAATQAAWADLASGWPDPLAVAGESSFNDLHALLMLLGSGQQATAQALLRACETAALAVGGGVHQAAVARRLGLPLMQALLAFGQGRCLEASQQLASVLADNHQLGGSHAQRDLLHQTLIAAAAGSGDSAAKAQGRLCLAARGSAKQHSPLGQFWAARLA